MTTDRTKIRWNGWGWTAHRDDLGARKEIWQWLASELGMPSLLATPPRPLEDIRLPPSRLPASDRSRLTAIVGTEQARDDSLERTFHALGRSYHDLLRLRAGTIPFAPDLVVYPRATDEVLEVLTFASDNDIAVVPFGGGTSVVGGVSAVAGLHKALITLDLSGMSRVIESDARSLTASAEAGIYGPSLEQALHARGLTLGHFPQSFEFSTLGGWIAHRGAGQGSNGYGRAEDWLLGVKVVTPRGLLETRAFPASSSGPDITELIVGSEGALGVVTEATFSVQPLPTMLDYRGYFFRSFESGAEAIRRAVQEAIPFTMLRLSDAAETHFYRAFGAVGKAPGLRDQLAAFYLDTRKFTDKACALIAGFEGDARSVVSARERFAAIAKNAGALSLGEGQGKRWREGRFHGPYLRDPMMDRGIGVDTLETAARWSDLPNLYDAVETALADAIRETAPREGSKGVVMCHISHSYPSGASLYFTYIFPRALEDELGQWRKIKKAATDAIVANKGTLSHHHGVGEDHRDWMNAEKGALGVDILRAVKSAVDPNGILNPGKLIPG